MRPSRRQVVAGALAGCAPTKGKQAGEAAPATVDTIVVVMMENRSFDHFLGSRALLEGKAENGLATGMSNADADGVAVEPYPNDVACLGDPGHGWGPSHDQFNGGLNDGFVLDYGGPEVMQYMTRADLPVTYALADAYAVCDAYFCSVMGPTWPNRFYGHAGTSDGQQDNDFPTDGAFAFPTVWHKLEEAGIDWMYYYVDLPFVGLFDGVMAMGNYGGLEDFEQDAANGKLPAVTWIDPGFTYCDDHPPHFVGMGQQFLARVYTALANSPHWERCLLLITYDEHGGFFDHVPPPTTEDDFADLGFDQLGFRVPSLVIGPWVKQGAVSTVFDHTSWLKMVCDMHGIAPWTKRMQAAASLAECLDLDRMERNEPLPAVAVSAPAVSLEELPAGCYGGGFGPPAPVLERWRKMLPAETAKLVRDP
jgi:phospholipase C